MMLRIMMSHRGVCLLVMLHGEGGVIAQIYLDYLDNNLHPMVQILFTDK